jgi:hypothetical protein
MTIYNSKIDYIDVLDLFNAKERLFMNKEQYIVDDHGRRTAVILPAKVYDQMLEDIHDLAVVAERRKEGTVTLAEMKKRMKKAAT